MSKSHTIVASLSGGKDSTAMVLMALDRGYDIAELLYYDTGWDFPEMADHLDRLERYTGMKITRLGPRRSFESWLLDKPVRYVRGPRKGQVRRIGNGWPSPLRRWCTREKIRALNAYIRGMSYRSGMWPVYVAQGFAAEECHRPERTEAINQRRRGHQRHWYPLIEWGVTEPEALAYCRDRGFDWGGALRHL